MKTVNFHCPKCGTIESWTANEIAEKGTPICWICDEDMKPGNGKEWNKARCGHGVPKDKPCPECSGDVR
jgi:transcription elongation factor Elf1